MERVIVPTLFPEVGLLFPRSKIRTYWFWVIGSDLDSLVLRRAFDLLSLSLRLSELRCSLEILRSLPGWFVYVDCKIPERSGRALGSLFAWTALLTGSDVAEGATPFFASAVVQMIER
jgi:hypothetical protein